MNNFVNNINEVDNIIKKLREENEKLRMEKQIKEDEEAKKRGIAYHKWQNLMSQWQNFDEYKYYNLKIAEIKSRCCNELGVTLQIYEYTQSGAAAYDVKRATQEKAQLKIDANNARIEYDGRSAF